MFDFSSNGIPLRSTRRKDRKTIEERASHPLIAVMTNLSINDNIVYPKGSAVAVIYYLKVDINGSIHVDID